jgi:hypothetical protein
VQEERRASAAAVCESYDLVTGAHTWRRSFPDAVTLKRFRAALDVLSFCVLAFACLLALVMETVGASVDDRATTAPEGGATATKAEAQVASRRTSKQHRIFLLLPVGPCARGASSTPRRAREEGGRPFGAGRGGGARGSVPRGVGRARERLFTSLQTSLFDLSKSSVAPALPRSGRGPYA